MKSSSSIFTLTYLLIATAALSLSSPVPAPEPAASTIGNALLGIGVTAGGVFAGNIAAHAANELFEPHRHHHQQQQQPESINGGGGGGERGRFSNNNNNNINNNINSNNINSNSNTNNNNTFPGGRGEQGGSEKSHLQSITPSIDLNTTSTTPTSVTAVSGVTLTTEASGGGADGIIKSTNTSTSAAPTSSLSVDDLNNETGI